MYRNEKGEVILEEVTGELRFVEKGGRSILERRCHDYTTGKAEWIEVPVYQGAHTSDAPHSPPLDAVPDDT